MSGTTIDGSYSTVAITAANMSNVGGLVGNMDANMQNSLTQYTYSGLATQTDLDNAVAAYKARSDVQALVAQGGTVQTGSYGLANWTGMGNSYYFYGYVTVTTKSAMSNSYATGSVNASNGSSIGGLVGAINNSTITDSYSTGAVNGAYGVGGLVGSVSNTTITDSFYDRTVNPTLSGAEDIANVGKTTAELHTQSTFANWNISSVGGDGTVWRMYEGNTAPLLRSFLTQVTGTVSMSSGSTQVYDGTTAISNASGTVAWSDANGAITPDSSKLFGSGLIANSKNVGTQTVSLGQFSNQSGYDIITAGFGTVEITKANLSVSGLTAQNKVYDATTTATLSGTAGVSALGSDSVTLSGTASGAFGDKNVGVLKRSP